LTLNCKKHEETRQIKLKGFQLILYILEDYLSKIQNPIEMLFAFGTKLNCFPV